MKEFFKKLTLPAKLILIGGLPLLFLLVIAFQYNKEKNEKLNLLEGFTTRIDQAIEINKLINQLQTERRYSFAQKLQVNFQNQMLLNRAKTDELLQAFEVRTETTLPGFFSYTFLDQLKDFRTRIDKQEVEAMEVLNFYTNIIFRLNTLNNVTAGNNVYLNPVFGTIAGQKILSDIITYKGMIIAQTYLMLATKEDNPQLVSSIIQLQNTINSFQKEFSIKAPPERIEMLENLKNDLDIKRANAVEEQLRATEKLDTSISAEFYWGLATRGVDKLKALQSSMIQEGKEGTADIYQREKRIQVFNLIALVVVLVAVAFFLLLAIKVIAESLGNLREAASHIAAGKTGVHIRPETNDAIGTLTQAIIDIDRNNQQLSGAARSIGEGKFDVEVQPRSEEDILGNAVVQMRDNLHRFRRSNEEKIWVQEGVARINDSIRGEKNVQSISQDALNTLAGYLECESGLLYLAQPGSLHFAAGYAISDHAAVPRQLAMGETLIGQVAQQQKMLLLEDVPEPFFQVRSGLLSASPKNLLIFPLCIDGNLEAVAEIASLNTISPEKQALISEVSNDIAIALRVARNKEKLQELFEQTQAQAAELQTQHSELENINAELEAQAEKLKASEEELRVQQEELLQANQELEERSRLLEERNQLILEKNLEIQRKAEELAISSKYKSEFLANMSHELRTPLNSVLLLSRLMAENNDRNLTPEQVEFAQVIQSSGQGLLSLIDEILDLSKIEAGKMDLEYQPVLVQEIVHDMKALFQPMARERGLEFGIEVAEGVPRLIETDKMRLEQVLKNLFSNALKFTSRGSVRMQVMPVADNPSFISFSVKDTGIGVPKDKQALIFEAFQQADGSTRRKFGGTGLGLSISRELTRLLGGEIKVSSEEGKGSEFTIQVPIKKATVQQGRNENFPEQQPLTQQELVTPLSPNPKMSRTAIIPESVPDDRNTIGPGDKTILIIEDDTSFALALLDFTRKKGYKGLVAVRGDEGVALAHQYRPIGILLDIMLPVKDGWEVMEDLKSSPATRPIPVHIMSSVEAKKESMVKGAVDFINKPLAFDQMQDVFKKIEHVLSKDHKKVLIVEENPKHAKALAYFLESFQVTTEITSSVNQGINALQKETINCVILDMGIPNQQAYQTLEAVKKSPGLESLPIIIFTGKNLSKSEEQRIRQYADSIVIKTAQSYQRILDEVSLFLHLMEENSSDDHRYSRYKRLGALNEVLADKTILVVDDDVRNIFSLTRALEVHQMKVVTAVDGKEALKQLAEHKETHVVLMDIMMPEMDGYEAMKAIRSQQAFKNLPIIAVTAKAMTGDREKCIQAGASDYISKPVDIDQLLSLLRVWLYDKSI